MKKIRYKGGYKYQLVEDYSVYVRIFPERHVSCGGYIELSPSGILEIEEGYAWDGPSGPTIDIPSFMRGSLVHDALYQLLRLRPEFMPDDARHDADEELRRMCRQDGMWRWASNLVFWAVQKFGKISADPASRKKIKTAGRV